MFVGWGSIRNDAFGNALEQTGTFNNPYRYSGYTYDEESDLYDLKARFYDAKIARFMQQDSYLGSQADPLSLNLYAYCNNNPIKYWDPTGHVVTQADIDRAYQNNPPDKAAEIIKGLQAQTDKFNNAKTQAERDAAHAEADRLRGIKTNANGTSSGKGGSTIVYQANPGTAVKNLVDKEKSNLEFSGAGTGKSTITYDSAFGGKIVLQENVDYYIINGTSYLYNSVDTRMVVDMAAARKSTGTVEAQKFVDTIKNSGLAPLLPNQINSQMVYDNAVVNAAYNVYVNQTTKFGDIYTGKDGRQHYTDSRKYGPAPPVPNTISIDTESVQQAFQNSPRGGDWDGVYGLQCVDLSWWFIDTYTTLNTSNGNGKDIVAKLVAANPGKLSVSTTPQAMSVFSVDSYTSSFGASGRKEEGHTGIVLSVDKENGTVTILDTYNGKSNPNSRVLTVPYPTSTSGVTFTYIGDYLK